MTRYSGWLIVMGGCLLAGCASGPLPEKAAWPWEYAKDYGKTRTGDFLTVRGNVAHFDEAPKAVKPVSPAALEPHVPDSPSATPATNAQPLSLPKGGEPASDTKESTVGEYDFALRNIRLAPSYVSGGSMRPSYDVTAFNHGDSPVSIIVNIDSATISTDKALPLTVVVPPNSDQILARITPVATEGYRCQYSWSIGDYSARHNSPQHYRFPFAPDTRAFAQVSGASDSSAFTRYAVIFSMPVNTPILAARKGTIVRIAVDKMDILHDDSTIATYGHLGRIADGMVVGKAVSAGDVIGAVGETADRKGGYFQLTVWRPEVPGVSHNGFSKHVSERVDFDSVSFPITFCTTAVAGCRVITEDQAVPGPKSIGSKKGGKRKTKK